jgi:tetratricopeptide (TPR) repeat protein
MDFEASKHAYPALTKNREISFPMMSLGSLKVEATTVERVRECLDRFDDTLRRSSNRKDNISVGRSLLCRKPPSGTKPHGIPSKLMSYGVKTLRKLEVQTELNDNLERYGPRHPLVGQSHHSLGLVLLCIENYEESIDHFDKSIRINTHAFGAKYPEIASSLMFMALAQFALERFDDAISSVTRVRHMRESELGKKHNEIYQIMNNLACMHFEQGNLNKAESLLQEALDLQREIFGTEPDFLKGVSVVLFNIAFVHAKSGAFPKALIELEGALQIRQDILFEDASTGDITENMAYILAIHQLQHGSGNIDDVSALF